MQGHIPQIFTTLQMAIILITGMYVHDMNMTWHVMNMNVACHGMNMNVTQHDMA